MAKLANKKDEGKLKGEKRKAALLFLETMRDVDFSSLQKEDQDNFIRSILIAIGV